jgi:hypothetical protein
MAYGPNLIDMFAVGRHARVAPSLLATADKVIE